MNAQIQHPPTPAEAVLRVWAAECRDKALLLIRCLDAYDANRQRQTCTVSELLKTVGMAAESLYRTAVNPPGP